jgi:hypothetical protein
MPRFIVTRSLPPLSTDQIKVVAHDVNAACDRMGNVQWIRSHITNDGAHSFCELEAPDADSCRTHARLANLPVDDVVAIGFDIGPVTD